MVSPFGSSFRFLLLSAALVLLGTGSAFSQWLVYDMRMKADEDVSVNFVHYTGAYLITPVNGGASTLIFTTETGGRFYAVAQNAGRYFIAASREKRRAVVSAVANVGTSQALYQASGPLNSTRSTQVSGKRVVALVATDLYGQLMTSDDEHEASAPGKDGSLGVVGTASLRGVFRKDLSDIMDVQAPTMGKAIDIITTLLEKYGYLLDTGDEPLVEVAPLNEPSPIPQTADDANGSLFPAGSREEMEKALRREGVK